MSKAFDFFRKHLAQTTPFPLGLEVEKAQGSYLYTNDGKRYLDLISGIAVSNIGHGHPAVVTAIKEQADQHLHVMVYGEYPQASSNALVEQLTGLLPDQLNSVYLVNSGAEAIEGALKLAKRFTGRSELVAFRGAYHGSTHGALSVSGNEQKKRAFRPLLPDVRFLDFNRREQLDQITEATAAVVIEPIQGDAGVRLPDQAYLQALRTRCNETGALLIFDEIQTGMGRTGKWFAFEHYGVQPDILCLAKALGGGLPLGAFIAEQSVMASLKSSPMLGHITTFGGNPLSCAAGLAALQVIEREGLLEQVEEKGAYLEENLRHPQILEIRRKGFFFAFEFASAEAVQQVVEYCLKNGVICFWFLSHPQAFRIAPPLNISQEEMDEAIGVIRSAMNRLA